MVGVTCRVRARFHVRVYVRVAPAGTGDKTVTFLGSHLDVVPANPETWEVDPFHLTRDGDKLYGRGTTDCLGHVAMITDLMIGLAEKRPALSRTVLAIFIANEENGEVEDIGVDGLHSSGKLDELGINRGPIFWVDSADSQPCVGTVGNMQWTLKANGKLFHSGLPHMVSGVCCALSRVLPLVFVSSKMSVDAL